MCDTLTLITANGVWLAKNSDRQPDEAQRVEYYSAQTTVDEITCTYIPVRARELSSQALIIGRPDWMWGAEMGVNEKGVAIGNEAVFTKLTRLQKKSAPKLLGMDLLRLALMEAESAETAIECIAFYLEKYGQGGNAVSGSKQFYYDNSFIIADSKSAWIMETAADHWAAKSVNTHDAISNRLIIRRDHQRSNLLDNTDFSSTFSAFLLPRLARAKTRRQQNLAGLSKLIGLEDIQDIRKGLAGLLAGHQVSGAVNTGNVCMHAKGRLCPDETVNSMIAYLPHGGEPQVWMTGCSHPCRSDFHLVEWSQNQWFAHQLHYWESARQSS